MPEKFSGSVALVNYPETIGVDDALQPWEFRLIEC